jgi:hypothetical protein
MKDIMLSWKKYLIEQTDTDQTMVSSITGSASEELKPTEQEVKDQAMSTIAASVENSLHDAKAVADRVGVDKSQLRAKLKAEIDQIIKENLYQVILEKNDRCTRIAKRKYKVWPSAYASGAVVKCRQGKIWKGISENMTDEEIDEALLLEEAKKKDYKPNFSKEKEQGLHGWFARNKGKGWINCRTGGPCGRESADSGGKYPACRPTKAQCKSAGKGPLRKKKSSKPISWSKKKKKD